MKSAFPLLLIAGALYLSQSGKSSSKKSTKDSKDSKEDSSQYEDFPDEVDKKINEENIYKYFSKNPLYLNTVPIIFADLTDIYKSYYDPNTGNKNAYLLINPDFAGQVWGYAMTHVPWKADVPNFTAMEADKVAKEILMKFSPDVYWKEGLTPYAWATPFAYTYASVNYLVRLAYAVINNLNIDYAPGSFEL